MAECGDRGYMNCGGEQNQRSPEDRRYVNRGLDTVWEQLRTEQTHKNIELYVYIVDTVKPRHNAPANHSFIQTGSAPNFQGGYITLCTCKHRMRSYKRNIEEWGKNVWIAGFTNRSEPGFSRKNWLFYLMKIGKAFKTHRELAEFFTNKSPETVEAKRADKNFLGDLFVPVNKPNLELQKPWLEPSNYIAPKIGRHCHRMPDDPSDWEHDIRSTYFGRNPALLLGEIEKSFLWFDPIIWYSEALPRTKRFFGSQEVEIFLNKLSTEKK
jgi:hypothetical protein